MRRPSEPWPSYRWLAGAFALAAAVVGLALLLASVHQALLLTFVAVILAFLVHHPIAWLTRWLPRTLATVITLLAFLSLVVGFVLFLFPILSHQATLFAQRIPQLVDELAAWWAQFQGRETIVPLPAAPEIGATLQHRLGSLVERLITRAVPVALGVFEVAVATIYTLAVAFFLAHRPSLYTDGLVRLVPVEKEEPVRNFITELGGVLRGWVFGALTSMTAVGILTGLGLWAVGIPSWLLLGFLAFALEIVPYAGPLISAVPGVALGLAESTGHGVAAALVYLGVQQLEGNLITPVVMKRAIDIPPALLLLWQVVLLSAFGVLAVLVAAPLLAIVMLAVEHFYVRGALGKK